MKTPDTSLRFHLAARSPFRVGRRPGLLPVFICFLPVTAWATCSPWGVQNETITMPTKITTPRDTPSGTALSPWVHSTLAVSRTCTTTVHGGGAGTALAAPRLTKVSNLQVLNEEGVKVDVYETGVAGVGVAFTGRVNGCAMTGYQNLGTYFNCVRGDPGLTIEIKSEVAAQYVVIGQVKAGVLDLNNPVRQVAILDSHPISLDDTASRYYDLSATTFEGPACQTPDVTVSLGQQNINQFPQKGSSTPAVPFQIQVNHCDASLAAVKYKLTSAQALDTTGVVGPSPASTASGIGVKVMDSDGAAIPLDGTVRDVTARYNAGGGSFSIPLKAAMYRYSETAPGAGTLVAEVQFTMLYQ
jgi:major type 1 subunit fimbrin (pilin)